MRLAMARTPAGEIPVRLDDGRARRLDHDGTLSSMLEGGIDPAELAVAEEVDPTELGPPLRPRTILAIGLNYQDHIDEGGHRRPDVPLVFTKLPSSVTGPTDPIIVDEALTARVDWEVELAVVVGRTMRHVAPERALEHVFGYTAANDVSARDLQAQDTQWVRGKGLDTFCPLGPAVVTADEIADPQALQLRTTVNAEVMQRSSTEHMLFGVADLLSFLSRQFTLSPGAVVLTGTPWGCGEFMDPPRHLHPGDVVECAVQRVGSLRNPVVASSSAI